MPSRPAQGPHRRTVTHDAPREAETRAEHIDPALKAAGWGVVEGSRVLREHGIAPGCIQGGGKRGRADVADYVLVYRNTKLGVIEAEAWDKPYTEGLGQAKAYAEKLAVRFTYATNGQQIWRVDMATAVEGDVAGYPTPDALWAATHAEVDAWRDRFAAVAPDTKGGMWDGRYYQEIAIARTLAAIAEGDQRILLTLATGTGKTLIAFQVAWKLFHSRWNLSGEPTRRPRILFLTDRNILADQAYNDFSSFADDALVRIAPDEIRKKGKVPTNGAIFFTIFQTFMSGPNGAPYFGDYPADFFDFIVVDECHRGGARDESTWRAILDYFAPAVQLGMTATPKRRDNVDTYAYFGEPVYVYSLKQGINDGFLTPFKVKQFATTLDEYVYTPDDEVVQGEIDPGRLYGETDFNRVIEIAQREAHRVKLFMGHMDQREKTLVFCATQVHALAVRDVVNQLKVSVDVHYCERVTANDGAIGDQHLRDFQDNEKTIPTILTTSQKLSTGVDARNVRNIVLMRPIRTMIEFKQIIGRGTRLYDGKDFFTIYDFVRAHAHFLDPEWDGEPLEPEPPLPPRPPGPPQDPDLPPDGVEEPGPVLRIQVTLADGKARAIQHMVATTYWHPDGRPMSAAQFLQQLYGTLPDLFKDEDELRALWSDPATRRQLLSGLEANGFGPDQLREIQRFLEAEHCDLYDVLAHIRFALAPLSRQDRADGALEAIGASYTDKQQAFLQFVLAQYVKVGVDELDPGKLSTLLKLRYDNAIADSTVDLGPTAEIRSMFVGFQKWLYEAQSVG